MWTGVGGDDPMQCHGTMERRSLPSPTSLQPPPIPVLCLSHLFFGLCHVFSLAPRVDGARGGDGVLETHPTPLARCSASRLEVRRQWRPAKDVPVMKIRNPAAPSHERGRISIPEGDRHSKGSPRPLCLIPSSRPPPLCAAPRPPSLEQAPRLPLKAHIPQKRAPPSCRTARTLRPSSSMRGTCFPKLVGIASTDTSRSQDVDPTTKSRAVPIYATTVSSLPTPAITD